MNSNNNNDSHARYSGLYTLPTGLLISNIDIDVDIIDDTFDVSISISTILSYKSIDHGIDDTLLAFLSTLHRYFSTDIQVRNINEQDNKAQNKLALTVALDKRN